MSANAYREVLNEVLNHVQYLPVDEQLQLVKELESLVREQATVKPSRSLLELEGLGAEIWQDVDVQKYIDQERDSWDG